MDPFWQGHLFYLLTSHFGDHGAGMSPIQHVLSHTGGLAMINDTHLTCILYSFKAKLTFAKLSDKTSVFLVFPLSLD